MAKLSSKKDISKSNNIRPALTPESRENQLIYLATNLAEQQLKDGTASSQVITHYLKLGSTKEKLEKEKLAKENELLTAKSKALESTKNIEELYTKAILAMRQDSGTLIDSDSDEESDDNEY